MLQKHGCRSMFSRSCFRFLFSVYSELRLLDYMMTLFRCLNNLHTVLYSDCTILPSQQQCTRVIHFLSTYHTLLSVVVGFFFWFVFVLFFFFDGALLTYVRWYIIMVFNWFLAVVGLGCWMLLPLVEAGAAEAALAAAWAPHWGGFSLSSTRAL